MSLRRLLNALLVVLLSAVAVVAVAPVALADGVAYLRLAHLSPDTPTVDVYVGSVSEPSTLVLPGVGYGAVSPYSAVEPGQYVISMRAAGAPADSPPVISTTVDAAASGAYTIAGTGLAADLGLTVLQDDLDMPVTGRASVRVINAAATTPLVDCGPAGREPWARGVRFGTSTAYTDVALGTWDLEVTTEGRRAAMLPVVLDRNSVYTVLLVDRDGTVAAELIQDSSGAGSVPVGGVDTGFGGDLPLAPVFPAAALLGCAVIAGLLVRVRAR